MRRRSRLEMTARGQNRRWMLPWAAGVVGVLVVVALWVGRSGVGEPEALAVEVRPTGTAKEASDGRAEIAAKPFDALPDATAAAEISSPAAEVMTGSSGENPAEEAAREAIESLTVSYDASVLPRLAGYLSHPSPEVRGMAREGIVQLGAMQGAAYLRAAADKATDPREAVALLDAADFLDLPPADFSGRAKSSTTR